jgi:hypothetical protein
MSNPILLIDGKEELALDRDMTTIGRAADNVIAFSEDSNVSRYHAEIEKRAPYEFWLFDLNSSNGTKLNGEPVTIERPLVDGDVVSIGGSHELEVFLFGRTKDESSEGEEGGADGDDGEGSGDGGPAVSEEQKKQSVLFILAGLAIGLAIISVVVVAVIYVSSSGGVLGGGCDAQAKIAKPQNGDILNEVTPIEVELSDPTQCVRQIVYTIDDESVASSAEPPFGASIDPNSLPGLSDGLDHKLKAVLIDTDGNQIPQAMEIALNFDTLVTETPPPTPGGQQSPGSEGGPGDQQQQQQNAAVTITDTKSMAEDTIRSFSGKGEYVTGNPGFLEAVNKLTVEYAQSGYFERARKFRDVIDTEFVQERGLDPPLGFILAMSRSKFQPTNDQKGAGLWRMDNKLVLEYRYNGLCGAETIANEKQSCASIAASNYLKDIILKVFGGNSGDIIYVIATFGMSPLDAAQWKQTLPEDRKDFWRILDKDPQKQDSVARFFAAAIVSEHPDRFGLKDDRPLSELYGGGTAPKPPAQP